MATGVLRSCVFTAFMSPQTTRMLTSRVGSQRSQSSSLRPRLPSVPHPPSAQGSVKLGHGHGILPKSPCHHGGSVRRKAKTVRTVATSDDVQSSVVAPGQQQLLPGSGDFKWDKAWYPVGKPGPRMLEQQRVPFLDGECSPLRGVLHELPHLKHASKCMCIWYTIYGRMG